MLKKFVATAMVLAMGSAAMAELTISANLYKTPDAAGGTNLFNAWTLDIVVDVTGGDDWTTATGKATINSVAAADTFVQIATSNGLYHRVVIGSDTNPDTPYDTAWDTTQADSLGDPNALAYADPTFVAAPTIAAKSIAGTGVNYGEYTWFDTPPNGGGGSFVIARYTFRDSSNLGLTLTNTGDLYGTFRHQAASVQDAILVTNDITTLVYRVPEPGALALLGLGGLVAMFRRR